MPPNARPGAAVPARARRVPGREGPPPAAASGVSVIVPTYREAGNVAALADRVAGALAPAGLDWELVFVDDGSGDGSAEIVARIGRRLPVRMEQRGGADRDLSRAVVRGLEVARFDSLVVMDADLSHPPERIPEMVAALAQAPMVLGSRYAAGGRVDRGWGVLRRVNSRIAAALARPLAPALADPMSGFFAVRRDALPDLGELRPIGYKIALEIVVRGGLRVHELPIHFRDRERGRSKLGWRQQVRYLRHLHRLYLHRFGGAARFASFAAVGGTGFLLDVGCYYGLQWLGLDHRLARFASFWPAVTWNWLANRALTFADRPRRPRGPQWAQFAVSSGLGLLANVGTYAVLTSFVAAFARAPLAALVVGVALGSVVNYAVADRVVYGLRGRPRRRSG